MYDIKYQKLDTLLKYLPKSKIKAGAGQNEGKYRFFKSGADQSKFIDIAEFKGESIIIGDGGNANINYFNDKFSTSDHCYVIQKQNNLDIDIKYIYYFLKTNLHILEAGFKGAGLKNISKRYISNIKIPIQPLEYQRQISRFLTQIEELIEKREESINLLDKLIESTFLDIFLNNTYRADWEVIKLENVINSIDGGWSPVCQNFSRKNNKYAVLKLSALSKNTYNAKENKEMKDETKPKINILVKNNDLLFTRKNTYELVGSCAYVFETEENLFLPDLIFRLNTNNKINKIYLWKLLTSLEWKLKLKKIANGAAGSMPNISKAKLLKLDCLLPPIKLQDKFSKIVIQIELTKSVYKDSLDKLNQLFNSTAQKAFKGKLNFIKEIIPITDQVSEEFISKNEITGVYKEEEKVSTFLEKDEKSEYFIKILKEYSIYGSNDNNQLNTNSFTNKIMFQDFIKILLEMEFSFAEIEKYFKKLGFEIPYDIKYNKDKKPFTYKEVIFELLKDGEIVQIIKELDNKEKEIVLKSAK